jgi:hypothetical protein
MSFEAGSAALASSVRQEIVDVLVKWGSFSVVPHKAHGFPITSYRLRNRTQKPSFTIAMNSPDGSRNPAPANTQRISASILCLSREQANN